MTPPMDILFDHSFIAENSGDFEVVRDRFDFPFNIDRLEDEPSFLSKFITRTILEESPQAVTPFDGPSPPLGDELSVEEPETQLLNSFEEHHGEERVNEPPSLNIQPIAGLVPVIHTTRIAVKRYLMLSIMLTLLERAASGNKDLLDPIATDAQDARYVLIVANGDKR